MQLWYVNVYVRDFDRALAFYRDTLGLDLQHADEAFGYASFVMAGGGRGLAIAAVSDEEHLLLVGRHTGIGLGVEDVDAEHARLAGAGVTFTMPPSEQPWGGYMAMFADPDGNVFYLDRLRDELA